MNTIRNYIILFTLLVAVAGCEDFFEPNYNNNLSEETVFNYQLNPEYIEGLYVPAYSAIPSSYNSFNSNFIDCATDNAVTNNYNSTPWKMYTIEDYITSNNYPLGSWGSNYKYIKDIYKFLKVGLAEDIVYRTSSATKNEQLKERMRGEAHFLLAYNYFELLRDYAGPVNGVIMGVPIVDHDISIDDAYKLERSTFDECVAFIDAHIDTALSSGLAAEYTEEAAIADSLEVTVYGVDFQGLPTTTACYMLRSRLMLYAASPAFSKGSSNASDLYLASATASKAVIDIVGELSSDNYNPSQADNYYTDIDGNPELILRRTTESKAWEQNNYPPSLGLSVQGRTNPSQNLVNAFPMANGYPISDLPQSGYDPTDPYTDRDPRFYMTVIHNNMYFKSTIIEMWEPGGNTTVGAPNISDDSRVSRTNYYLRKHMTQKPSFITGVSSTTPWHWCATFRAVEAYLNYAEAVNQVVGADAAVDGLTAREALRAVRYRANVPADAGSAVAEDPYLASVSGDDFTNLVKNERRIELCFEGHRYYDVRRWMDDLNTKVKGVSITTPDYGFSMEYNFDEDVYPNQVQLPEYMRYGAIPKSEILACPNLRQNDGWK